MLYRKYNLHVSDIPHFKIEIPSCWKIIVEIWGNFNYCSLDHVVAKFHIYLQLIWGNSNIHIENKPVFWDNFRPVRVIYICDY